MRTIIAGSRGIEDYQTLVEVMETIDWKPSVILSGTARGADRLGERWAREHGVPLELYPADWERYGRSAGYRRNETMAQNADALVALWDGESRGTKHMIDLANKYGLTVVVVVRRARKT